jgi:hypothetical protein
LKVKKFYSGIFFALMLIIAVSPTYAANIQIKVDGVAVASDMAPETRNNSTMVPLRVISENLGAKVNWLNQLNLFSDTAIQSINQIVNTAAKNGFLTVISNTVV